jgi:hypothetical protein
MQTKTTNFQIGNYVAEQIINNDPYLFDADGEPKIVGKNIWRVTHNKTDFVYYSKTKKRAKERMFYLANHQP